MKKILLLSVCMLAMFISCSKDDDNDDKNNIIYSEILGSWSSTYVETYNYDDMSLQTRWHDPGQWYFTLHKDGTCTYHSFDGTFKLEGRKLTIYYTSTINGENLTNSYVIKELYQDKMILSEERWSSGGIHSLFVYTMERK